MSNNNPADPILHRRDRTQWAQSATGDETYGALEALTVRAMATKRADFETCTNDEMVSAVIERNRGNQFDFLPVVERTTGQIVGLIEIATFVKGTNADRYVNDLMHPLSEANLIGADASILAFVRDADRQRCRLVVSREEISGLVSLSDLQQLPVRAAIFALVTNLEIIMANLIRKDFNGTDSWLDCLSDRRRHKIKGEIRKAQIEDCFVDSLLFTLFWDKQTILANNRRLITEKDLFEIEFKNILGLRNHLAHANDYAASPETAANTCRTVRMIDKWSSDFNAFLNN